MFYIDSIVEWFFADLQVRADTNRFFYWDPYHIREFDSEALLAN